MIKISQIDENISFNMNHLGYTRKFAIERLDKIHYVEYYYKEKQKKLLPQTYPNTPTEYLKH